MSASEESGAGRGETRTGAGEHSTPAGYPTTKPTANGTAATPPPAAKDSGFVAFRGELAVLRTVVDRDDELRQALAEAGAASAAEVPEAKRAAVVRRMRALIAEREFGIEAASPPITGELASATGEQIPEFLRLLPRWLTWKLTTNPQGKPTKKPDRSTRDSRAASYQEVAKVPRSESGGIGFVTTGKILVPLSDGNAARLLLVDVDACRDPRTGGISPWAARVLELLSHPYAEVSPSGTGLRMILAVVNLPANLKATLMLTGEQPPPGVDKKPQIQLFGLGPAGYVALTGQRIERCAAGLTVESNLDRFLQVFAMIGGESPTAVTTVEEIQGIGNVPTDSEIAARIAEMPHGRELLAADWQKVMPEKSASEAFHRFVGYVLNAANGHGEAALDFLMNSMWGTGQVDDSKDPSKYGRRSWVAKEIARVATKQGTPKTTVDRFDTLPEQATARAPANGTTSGEPPDGIDPDDGVGGDPLAIVQQIEHDGPLVRLATGLATLDAMTGGGFVLGSRVYLIGAPDAGKTAFAVQIADVYLRQGVPVGILGIDEEPVDIVTRFMQRRGMGRVECEERSAATIARMEQEVAKVPLRLFDARSSIEEAARKLHEFASARAPGVDRPPCVLVIDSVQAARCSKEQAKDGLYAQVTERVRAIRSAASRYRMLVIATSEMNRGAYRSKKVDEQAADMASAKESGAIEFSARVLLSLRSVQGSSDVVALRVVKNKHGPSHRDDQDGIFLRTDRAAQQIVEDTGFEPVDLDDRRAAEASDQVTRDAARVAQVLTAGDLGVNALKAARKAHGLPPGRVDAARAHLIEMGAIEEQPAPQGGKKQCLRLDKLPPGIRARMTTAGSDPK